MDNSILLLTDAEVGESTSKPSEINGTTPLETAQLREEMRLRIWRPMLLNEFATKNKLLAAYN